MIYIGIILAAYAFYELGRTRNYLPVLLAFFGVVQFLFFYFVMFVVELFLTKQGVFDDTAAADTLLSAGETLSSGILTFVAYRIWKRYLMTKKARQRIKENDLLDDYPELD